MAHSPTSAGQSRPAPAARAPKFYRWGAVATVCGLATDVCICKGSSAWHSACMHDVVFGVMPVPTCADLAAKELAAMNERYEAKFGHIFIICASGRAAEDMLAAVQQR